MSVKVSRVRRQAVASASTFDPAAWLRRPPRGRADVLEAARLYAAATSGASGPEVWAVYWPAVSADVRRDLEARLAGLDAEAAA